MPVLSVNQELIEIPYTSTGEELVHRSASGDAGARLQLVKANLDFVTELASQCTLESGLPFSRTVQIGISSVIRAADSFQYTQQTGFTDHVRQEFIRAIEGMDCVFRK